MAGHLVSMSDPNDDLSSVADPGSMGPDEMTEPDNDMPGDLDIDHANSGRGDQDYAGSSPDSQAIQGAPLGLPD